MVKMAIGAHVLTPVVMMRFYRRSYLSAVDILGKSETVEIRTVSWEARKPSYACLSGAKGCGGDSIGCMSAHHRCDPSGCMSAHDKHKA